MKQEFKTNYSEDRDGYPSEGQAEARGISINFQAGPVKEEPNGAFVETLIAITIDRLRYYQEVRNKLFACRENALAITHLEEAAHWLDHRTADRNKRGVEGTHKP